MKYLIWILLLFAAAVAVVTASHNPAYVLLIYPPYRIELSLALFIIGQLIVFGFGYALLRLLFVALHLPDYVRGFRLERSQMKARKLLEEALGAFFEGRYATAEKASAKAMDMGDTSALHPIIAARSAHELREYEKRDAYLSAAEGKSAGDATMRLMASAKFMLDQHAPQAALQALQALRDGGVKGHPGVLALELKARQQAGDWDEVLRVLDQLEKRNAIDVTVATQLRQQAWLEKLHQMESLEELVDGLKQIPAELKRRNKVCAAAARALIRHGGGEQAQKLLSDSLNAQWDSELVALYGDCHSGGGDATAQIEQAEKWLGQHRDDAGLLLALGKLCIHQKLWGKAQNYLDASLSLSPSREVYLALAHLGEKSGAPDKATRYYQSAMDVALKNA
ncbi:MAG: heme biosynthesis HemY N-terminal domain-containing protein [Gallionella sp.]|nr:heme biosynthesis HemY N-terminal domain-containing protein [Gallionella sp.]